MDNQASHCIESIDNQLAQYQTAMRRVVKLLPDFISPAFSHESHFPVAAVCLRDCQSTIGQALYAFHQYCELRAEDGGTEAEAFRCAARQRFYLEDAAMRIYSAAEHLANAVLMMRQLPDVAGKGSRWLRVCKVLEGDTLRSAMEQLADDPQWLNAVALRNSVVHEQPPRMAGLGRGYKRVHRWSQDVRGNQVLTIGPGDEPEWRREDAASLLVTAAERLIAVLNIALDEYYATLKDRGVLETPTGLSVPVFYPSL